MKNVLSFLGTLALCVSFCSAAETPESIRFSGAEGFQKLSEFKPIKAKTSHYVRLSGSINLNGSGYVPVNPSYAYVTVNGSTNLSGQGGYQTGYTSISQSVSIFLNGNFVSQFVQINAYVQVYKNGRYVGSTYAQGSINVTGWNNNGWVNLSGYGTLTGDIMVQED
jgi:hypothetical protein